MMKLKLQVKHSVNKTSLFKGTYREMEDSLGIILSHGVTFQRDVVYPAALGEQQVCSWRQGVDIRSRGGSNRLWHPTVVNTYRTSKKKSEVFWRNFNSV